MMYCTMYSTSTSTTVPTTTTPVQYFKLQSSKYIALDSCSLQSSHLATPVHLRHCYCYCGTGSQWWLGGAGRGGTWYWLLYTVLPTGVLSSQLFSYVTGFSNAQLPSCTVVGSWCCRCFLVLNTHLNFLAA